jgi:hypothetical protein
LFQAGLNIISLLWEHVIGKEVESALQEAMQGNVRVNEFTVAPQITPDSGLPPRVVYWIWTRTGELVYFAEAIDNEMRKQNIYYDDLIVGNILKSSYYGCG